MSCRVFPLTNKRLKLSTKQHVLGLQPRSGFLCSCCHSYSISNTGAWHQVQPVRRVGEHSEAPRGEGTDGGGRPQRGRLGECLARGMRGKGAIIVIDPFSFSWFLSHPKYRPREPPYPSCLWMVQVIAQTQTVSSASRMFQRKIHLRLEVKHIMSSLSVMGKQCLPRTPGRALSWGTILAEV